MTPVGRPPIAYGIWPEMIEAAGSVGALADVLGMTRRALQWTFTGLRVLQERNAERARAFARGHGITVRVYAHPTLPGYLLSTASGWFYMPKGRARTEPPSPVRRLPGEDWSSLSLLELDFASTWGHLADL